MEDLSGCSKQTMKKQKNHVQTDSVFILLLLCWELFYSWFPFFFFFPYIIPRRPRPPVGQDGPLATSRARRQTTMAWFKSEVLAWWGRQPPQLRLQHSWCGGDFTTSTQPCQEAASAHSHVVGWWRCSSSTYRSGQRRVCAFLGWLHHENIQHSLHHPWVENNSSAVCRETNKTLN